MSSTYSLYPYIYCGYRNFPPPYLTRHSIEQFRIHFRSNDDDNAGSGFYGRYEFLNQSHSLFSSICRSPFDSIIYVNETDKPSGNLSSNGYPENIICEWSYITTSGFQFNLELSVLELEGSKTKDPPQGCQTSVLRIYSEGQINELCGKQEKISYILTKSNWFTVQFISLRRQTRELFRGFYLSWTVVQVRTNLNNYQCLLSNDYFDCKEFSNKENETLFCIHRSLICDGYIHCQPLSNNDEHSQECIAKFSSFSYLLILRRCFIWILIVITISIAMLCICSIIIFLFIKAQQRRHDERLLNGKSTKWTKVYLDNNQDLSHMKMLEQTVTSV